MRMFLTLCFLWLSLWFPERAEARKATDLAAALARLRSEVGALSAKIDEKRRSIRSRLRSIAMRKSALELSMQRARLRLQQLSRQRDKQKARIAQLGQREASLKPMLLRSIQRIRAEVAASLPFRMKARLAVLERLKKKLKAGLLRPRKAASRLWQCVEDELRLSRENGLYRQIIKLQNKAQLVDVARLGLVMLFFKTKDGKYGSAAFRKGQWSFELLADKRDKARVSALFVAMKQQIRVGFWHLPNRLRMGKK